MDLREAIPGYAEALHQEGLVREAAFLDITETVGRFELRAMTLRDYVTLNNSQSPVMKGIPASPQELIAFLWFLSPAYRPGWSPKAYITRKLFGIWAGRILRDPLALAETDAACQSYLTETFQDYSPPEPLGYFQPSSLSGAANICAKFGSRFGWDEERTVGMKMKKIFQYLNWIKLSEGDNAPIFMPSDRVKSEWILKVNKRN